VVACGGDEIWSVILFTPFSKDTNYSFNVARVGTFQLTICQFLKPPQLTQNPTLSEFFSFVVVIGSYGWMKNNTKNSVAILFLSWNWFVCF
jgi:hypothetical protein